jgi:hypothetical protein
LNNDTTNNNASNNTGGTTPNGANNNSATNPNPNPNPPIDWTTVQTQESFLQLLSADFEGNIVGPILAGMEELAISTCLAYSDANATMPFDEFLVGDRKMTFYSEMSYRVQLLELLVNIAPPGTRLNSIIFLLFIHWFHLVSFSDLFFLFLLLLFRFSDVAASSDLRGLLERVWSLFLGTDKPRTAHQVSLGVDFFRKLRRAYVGGSRNGIRSSFHFFVSIHFSASSFLCSLHFFLFFIFSFSLFSSPSHVQARTVSSATTMWFGRFRRSFSANCTQSA